MIARLVGVVREPWNVVEIFVVANLAFLTGDVYLAHSVNAFERPAEWVPVYFSIASPLLLIVAAIVRGRAGRALALVVGAIAVVVGTAGMLYHLESHFFVQQTIRNLVYTAPFVAPVAYAGLGMLLICDRMEDPRGIEWAQWIVFLALGGFAGNFVLSLADHAQNGFFNRFEWVPVASSAVAVAFLLLVVLRPEDATLLRWTWYVLALQVVVGLAGFAFHLRADLRQPSPRVWDRFLYGAPVFAPLLFPNLAILAAIGLWALRRNVAART
ncbi:MAG TPA: hypothetical protein VL284_20215 [Thermoanaerobaculia bacterium]|nr:hypothetical protein [Thermoanaerobaculia bacterium]